MPRPYLRRLRELHKRLCQEPDILKRVEILDRMLFVIEAQARSYSLDNAYSDVHGQAEAIVTASRNERGASAEPTLPGYLKLALELQSRFHRDTPEKFA